MSVGDGRIRGGVRKREGGRVMLLSYTKDGLVCQCEMVSWLIHMLGPTTTTTTTTTIRVLSSGPTHKKYPSISLSFASSIYVL